MKNLIWVKTIAILCIVLGVFGFWDALSGILFSTVFGGYTGEFSVSPVILNWALPISIGKLLANAACITAGILLLIRKPWAIKWVFGALIASILIKLLPMIFLARYSSGPMYNYEWNTWNLLRPAIYVILLMGVWRISGDYSIPPDELDNLVVENRRERRRLSPRQLKTFSAAGLVCMLIPLSILALYFYTLNSGYSNEEAQRVFYSFFPAFLQGKYSAFYLGFLASIPGIAFSGVGLSLRGERLWKILNAVVLALSIVLFHMFLWTLL
jgi:hypothetical protein